MPSPAIHWSPRLLSTADMPENGTGPFTNNLAPPLPPPQNYSIAACGNSRVDADEDCDPPGHNCSALCLFNASVPAATTAAQPVGTWPGPTAPSSPSAFSSADMSWAPPLDQTSLSLSPSGTLAPSRVSLQAPSVTIEPTVPGVDPTVRGEGEAG